MFRLPLLVLLCLLVYVPAYADDVVIESGTITIVHPQGNFITSMGLLGTGFSMSGGGHSFFQPVSSAFCPAQSQCSAGSLISLSGGGNFDSTEVLGSYTLNGQNHPLIALNMNLIAGDALIPTTGDALITLVAPFSVSFLEGIANGAFVSMSGHGDAYLRMSLFSTNLSTGPQYKFESLTYVFVPEPSTWILLFTGLIGFSGILRTRYKRSPLSRQERH